MSENQNPTVEEVLHAINEMRTQLDFVTQENQALRTEVASLTQPTRSSNPIEPKINPPETFNGSRHKCKNFLLQCKTVFSAQPSRYGNEHSKLAFAVSYLRGNAYDWISSFMCTDGPNQFGFASFDDFANALDRAFGDPLRQKTAERRLMTMTQGDRSVVSFAVYFQATVIEAEYTLDSSLVLRLFYNALSEEIKDDIFKCDRPDTFEEYKNLAISIESRQIERKFERKLFKSSGKSTKSGSSQDPTGPAPMQIDALQIRRGKLSAEERQERMRLGVCLYCGKKDHFVKECPNRKTTAQGN